MILPCSKTNILSACITVDKRCAIKTVILFLSEIFRIVSLISSSVIESKAEVASSKINKFGFLKIALAIDKRCFSPPETLIPPSPIVVFNPSSARLKSLSQLALFRASYKSSSVAFGFTNKRFSRIVPENNCAS
ncbi:hypothetical protein D9M71_698550 [compost metagenome]